MKRNAEGQGHIWRKPDILACDHKALCPTVRDLTLLTFDSLEALRQEPSAGQTAIRIASDLMTSLDP